MEKVLLINNCHYRRGGADVVYLNTGELLRKNGHQVIFFSTKSDQNEATRFSEYFINDINPLKIGFIKQILSTPRRLYSLMAKRNLERLIKDTKPDLAHIHLYKGSLTASILPVLKKNKIPTVITLHDFSLLCPRNLFLDGYNNICQKCLTTSNPFNCVINRCNRRNIFFSVISYIEFEINNKVFKPESYFDRIISVSKFNLEKHTNRKGLLKKFVQIYNFSPEINNEVPNHIKGNYFFSYGRLSIEKGFTTLAKAWTRLDTHFKLIIAGEGNMKTEISRIIQSNNNNNIDLLGFKSGKELNELIKNASYIIVPSECYENNPMTIIEGYSLGKPVIASNIGGITEIIQEGKTGFLFEFKNMDDLALKVRFADSLSVNDYEVLSKNARNFAIENFSEESHYKKLIKTYTEVIKI